MPRLLLIPLLLNSCVVMAAEYRVEGPAWVFTAESSFTDTRDNLVLAIESRGIVITNIAHANVMLNRTAETFDIKTPVYADAEIISFCKSDLSHKLVAANPHNLTLCPYSISVYTLFNQPGPTYLSIRAPYEAEPATAPITQLLIDIIEETQQDF